jgi:hypothetical protein
VDGDGVGGFEDGAADGEVVEGDLDGARLVLNGMGGWKEGWRECGGIEYLLHDTVGVDEHVAEAETFDFDRAAVVAAHLVAWVCEEG